MSFLVRLRSAIRQCEGGSTGLPEALNKLGRGRGMMPVQGPICPNRLPRTAVAANTSTMRLTNRPCQEIFTSDGTPNGECQLQSEVLLKFIVHIGDGKAGSSAIQYAMSKRTGDLRKRGIICDGISSGHFCLPLLLGKTNRGDERKSLSLAKMALENLKKNSEKMPGGTILLSAESFFSLTPDEVITILHKISPDVSDLKIIAYIRRPDERYLSTIQQQIKGDGEFTKPDQFVRRVDKVIEQWLTEVRCSEVIVRPFCRDRLDGGSVVYDFENVIRRLTGVTLGLEDNQKNSTLSAEQMIVLQSFRGYNVFVNGKFHPASQALIKFFHDLNKETLVGHKPELTKAAKLALIKSNTEVTHRVNELVPDLLPTAALSLDVNENVSWSEMHSIDSVLANFDASLVTLLFSLIPLSADGERHKFGFEQVDALRKLAYIYSIDVEFVFRTYFNYVETTLNIMESRKNEQYSRLSKVLSERDALRVERDTLLRDASARKSHLAYVLDYWDYKVHAILGEVNFLGKRFQERFKRASQSRHRCCYDK